MRSSRGRNSIWTFHVKSDKQKDVKIPLLEIKKWSKRRSRERRRRRRSALYCNDLENAATNRYISPWSGPHGNWILSDLIISLFAVQFHVSSRAFELVSQIIKSWLKIIRPSCVWVVGNEFEQLNESPKILVAATQSIIHNRNHGIVFLKDWSVGRRGKAINLILKLVADYKYICNELYRFHPLITVMK